MYKTSKIIIENSLESIEPVIEYVKSVATMLKLNEKEQYRICYAIEEKLQKSILFDFEPSSTEEIEIKINSITSGLEVCISDHGIPKDSLEKTINSIDELALEVSFESIKKEDSDQIDAISDFVIHKLLNRYTYINRGQDGRSVEMVIYASDGLVPKEVFEEREHNSNSEVKFSFLRKALPTDIIGISRLFYKSYGYTYVNDIVYYPERLAKAIENRTLISSVAISNMGQVIGHIALMQPFENAQITEWGMAISDPIFRGQGIMSKLIKNIMQHALTSQYRGLFSHSVTNHEFTQKICEKNNFSDVALLVGYAGAKLSFKNIHDKLQQRESTIISFKMLQDFKTKQIFLPQKHKEIIKDLYAGIGIEVMQKNITKSKLSSKKTKLTDTIISSINIAEIILDETANDTLHILKKVTKKLCIAKVDILYLFINLEEYEAVNLVDKFEDLGYIFAGIFPYYHHTHTLVLQYFNNIKFDYTLISSYSSVAIKLKEYIRLCEEEQ